MPGLSVTPYFPFRRVVLKQQSVGAAEGWLEARPDERYAAICIACRERLGRLWRWEKRAVRDLNLGAHRIWINYGYRKMYCRQCGGIRIEDLGFVAPYQHVTKRMASYVQQLCRQGLTVSQVSEHVGLNWKTVKRLDQQALEAEYGQTDYTGLKVLAVDEIALRKHYHYLTVVLDYQSGRVVWVGEGRKIETLLSFFAGMSEEQRAHIEAVALDMWEPYLIAIREAIPQAKVVFDLYHVVALFNRVIDEVRVFEHRKAQARDQAIFKGSKYLLLKNRENLRTPREREHLRQLLALNQVIFILMILKDLLKRIWSYRSRGWALRRLREWCALARTLDHPAVRKFANMLERYASGILNHCDYPIHTSRLEGTNNTIKVIKRQAYGFHDVRYFILKIIQAFDPKNRSPGPIPAN